MNDMTDDLRYAWIEGYRAYTEGQPRDRCPYDIQLEMEAWQSGWDDAQEQSE